MKLGISSYTYGWAVGLRGSEPAEPLDELGLLDRAQAFGVRLLQIGDNVPLVRLTPERLQRLAARAAESGIELEIGGRGLTPENLAAHAELARRLRAPILRFVIDDTDYHPAPGEVVEIIREALPLLEDTTLGIENHDRFAARTLRDVMEEIGSDRVGICLDTANSLGAGEGLNEVVEALAPHTVNLHAKDFGIERVPYLQGFTIEGRPAGRGMMNLPRVLEQLAPFGRCRSTILEQWVPPKANIEATIRKEAQWAEASIAYLRQFPWDE